MERGGCKRSCTVRGNPVRAWSTSGCRSAPEGEAALEVLEACPTVINVIFLREAAHKPDGDVILCDVAREDASVIHRGPESARHPPRGLESPSRSWTRRSPMPRGCGRASGGGRATLGHNRAA